MFGINFGTGDKVHKSITSAYSDLKRTVKDAFSVFEKKLGDANNSRQLAETIAEPPVVQSVIKELRPSARPDNLYENIKNITVDTALGFLETGSNSDGDYNCFTPEKRTHILYPDFNSKYQQGLVGTLRNIINSASPNLENRELATEISDTAVEAIAHIDSVKQALTDDFVCKNYNPHYARVWILEKPTAVTLSRSQAHAHGEANMQGLREELNHLVGLIDRYSADEGSSGDNETLAGMKADLLKAVLPYTQKARELIINTRDINATTRI
jgi:hypothetical protein